MSRQIIRIDPNLCNGCGNCIIACGEQVLALQGSKATLIEPDFCDGYGACLSVCPSNALSLKKLHSIWSR